MWRLFDGAGGRITVTVNCKTAGMKRIYIGELVSNRVSSRQSTRYHSVREEFTVALRTLFQSWLEPARKRV